MARGRLVCRELLLPLLCCIVGQLILGAHGFITPSPRVAPLLPTTQTQPSLMLMLVPPFNSSSSHKRIRRKRTIMSAVGFIGIGGIMGEGMGGCLINDGIAGTADTPLIVWNRTKNKALDFQKQYSDKNIVVLDTAKEVVERCGVVYSMLSTPEASKIVFEATDGVLAGVHDKTSLVDCATLAERDMQRMNSAVVAKGGRFLEAPVSGSKVPAAKGLLIFLCSGNKDLFDEIKDTGLKSMGKASHFFGDSVGGGTRAKLVVNSLMGTMLAAFGEGLALAESVGLNADTMMEVISQGAITSPVYSLKGPKMVAKDHAPNFPLKHATKDMTLAKQMAEAAGVEYSVMNSAEKLLVAARDDPDLNLADMDFSAVFEKIHKDSSSEFSKKRMGE